MFQASLKNSALARRRQPAELGANPWHSAGLFCQTEHAKLLSAHWSGKILKASLLSLMGYNENYDMKGTLIGIFSAEFDLI